MQLKSEYIPFYFDGRDNEIDTDDLDIDELAERCMTSAEGVHETLLVAVTKLAAPLADMDKREWTTDNKDVIDAAGGDANEAYRHYCQGSIDEAVYLLEPDVLEVMDPREEEPDNDDSAEEEDDDIDDEDDEDDDEEGEEGEDEA